MRRCVKKILLVLLAVLLVAAPLQAGWFIEDDDTPVRSLDPDALAYRRLVMADGGAVLNLRAVSDDIRELKALGQYSNAKLLLSAYGGVKYDSSGYVSKVYDYSPNHNHAVQPTGSAQPLLVPGAQNARPVLRFNGTSQGLYVSSISLNTYLTMLYAGKIANGGTSGSIVGHGLRPDLYDGFYLRATSYSAWRVHRDSAYHDCVGVTNWTGTEQIVGAFRYGADGGAYYKNGVLQHNGIVTGTVRSQSSVAAKLFIFQNVSVYTAGDLDSMFIIDGALSDSVRSAVEAYLKTRWGIS